LAGFALAAVFPVLLIPFAVGDEQQRSREGLKEPVFRVSKRFVPPDTTNAEHPLDPAIEVAREALVHVRDNVRDYSCTIVKRERIDGEVGEQQYMLAQIRNRKIENGKTVVPLSVYLYFLKPANIKGQETIYVEGRNDGKLVGHGVGWKATFGAVFLKPDGRIAMEGQLYPITEIGIENLIVRLIERAEQDRQHGEVNVEFIPNVKLNGRSCTLLQVTHPEKRPYFDFNIAQVFIDDEYNLPIRYASYFWPSKPGGRPELIEEYTYLNLKLNVGLTEDDFDYEKKFRY
jgi:hypothetical protein